MWWARYLVVAMLAASPTTTLARADSASPAPLRPTVLSRIDHDPTAFTEGLFISGTSLYESTGLLEHSQLRELDPTTGQLRRSAQLPPTYFGEGIADNGEHIWQLTYQNGVAIEWDKASLTSVREVPLHGEGWGLCSDGSRLIRSDGTARLHFHRPEDMEETGGTQVTYNGSPVPGLNSLSCFGNQIWANVFPTNRIIQIDAATGVVQSVVYADGLLDTPHQDDVDVLNGIAHLDDGQFLLTGKNWPTMYRVRFDPA
ncbi:glutaminyl-peptide cyclotransferase [Mycobacterium sp. CBMA293]|uniref:glutaminyl-peptide cyclotransferase n=1 Tax=unclassified Mycolicibacterium TaxID=2636767 RepID=UPI0012DDA0E7|nr:MULTISPECIES: glutaminyl-peptide cyclotransferase [unclassified Mycolicibacterium]MUL49098.1 glutaminyl-peptide cyclotransferase [Mycolicibacterium sp. CBMA 360]MUL62647.1 glutaminyl-peptide cyclotransferase [Mycolicibacterium sp. CBMA 335]MUL69666.1 glutaminyl-peptide cyclotransferase [Mycolicibacterium sp. CBMA 311]MUL97292.1 glutaminyl-peptide cyclotransferase [Mycolicibacterium sp. CBMA 230]MUM07948.1 glutaminyl-peptide cyclotransferase [Mycolicibacterium sp. CBMA 213]